jgi:hypothetical protein
MWNSLNASYGDKFPMESSMHLYFECSFSQGFWWALGFEWNADLDINTMIMEARNR